jgi:acetyltransferase-like isoleucine patch superfamily enzyme
MRRLLPAPEDHAFADGVCVPKPGEPGFLGRVLEHAASVIMTCHARRLQRAVWHQFEQGAELGPGVMLATSARLINRAGREKVRIGARTTIRGIIRAEGGARVEIGELVYLGDGSLVSAASSVTIGRLSLVAHGVQIFDNTSHPLRADERASHWRMINGLEPKKPVDLSPRPVVIGENCWIGLNAIILPGTTIGDRSIVSAGSVVQGDVPPDVIYRGAAGADPSIRPLAA